MRWWPVLMLSGCVSEKVTDPSEADADVDADADSDADSDADTDPTVLINFAPDCDDVRAIGPGATESGHLAGAILGPDQWPWRVDTVKLALSNEAQSVLTCDASKAHTVSVWVLGSAESRPPNDRAPDQTLEFPAAPVEDPVRLLAGDLDPPIELQAGERLAVAVKLAGFYPDSSCITACSLSWVEGVDFWSNAAMQPYNWSALGDFGIESNLWIFAEGEPVQ